MPLTQHQMRNIGYGNTPDAPLTYAVQYKPARLVCYLTAFVSISSEDAAVEWGKRMFGTQDVKARLV